MSQADATSGQRPEMQHSSPPEIHRTDLGFVLFYLCSCIFVCVGECHMCWIPTEARRWYQVPGAGGTNGCELSVMGTGN